MKNEYLEFVESLEKVYLEQRCEAIENLLASMDDSISWIGTGRQEICKNFSEAAQALVLAKREYSGGFSITSRWYETRMIAKDACIVYGEFCAIANDKVADVENLHHRVSAVCAKTPNGMKLLHIHMSRPDDDQEYGEYFVKKEVRADKKTLSLKVQQANQELNRRSKELEVLTANIPGGVHQCKNDKALTIVHMSDGFLSMFGYTREEIKNIFSDSFTNMIYEGDREDTANTIMEQVANARTVEIEYRIKCKDGSLMWVLDRGRLVITSTGIEYFFCVMLDISDRKKEDEKLRLALERHQVIMNQATDIIFEWDINEDTIDFSSNWEKRFGYPPITKEISKKIPKSENIHPEDMHCFLKIMDDTAAGVSYSETEFRIKGISGEYTWCRIRATTQFNNEKNPIKAVGVIVNIEEEKSKRNVLLEAAQRDSLTQLYNKNTTKMKIDKVLENQETDMTHALMMIDVDDFKNINDSFGHQCGDAVLTNMSKALKKLFRATDVVGRIGGDEFIVFMTNINNEALATKKAKEIVQIFKAMPIEIGGALSCSVGISIYPKDGEGYDSLVRSADKALYEVKKGGKANFAFHNRALDDDMAYSALHTVINSEIDSEVVDSANKDLVQYIFKLLYDAEDIRASINHVLEVVGRTYGVSRAYIFENSEDGRYCSNTFEWCDEGISPEINKLQKLSYEEDLEGFFDVYDENGVFYCQDIQTLNTQLMEVLEPQGVVSVLQCFMKDRGEIKGYMGFDECTNNRYWTKGQVDTLLLISNVLSTFLIKQKLNEQVVKLKGNY